MRSVMLRDRKIKTLLVLGILGLGILSPSVSAASVKSCPLSWGASKVQSCINSVGRGDKAILSGTATWNLNLTQDVISVNSGRYIEFASGTSLTIRYSGRPRGTFAAFSVNGAVVGGKNFKVDLASTAGTRYDEAGFKASYGVIYPEENISAFRLNGGNAILMADQAIIKAPGHAVSMTAGQNAAAITNSTVGGGVSAVASSPAKQNTAKGLNKVILTSNKLSGFWAPVIFESIVPADAKTEFNVSSNTMQDLALAGRDSFMPGMSAYIGGYPGTAGFRQSVIYGASKWTKNKGPKVVVSNYADFNNNNIFLDRTSADYWMYTPIFN